MTNPRKPNVPKVYQHELKREHLLQKIRKAQDASIVALVAPSGYGKTTLLAQFARSARKKVAWLTLDESHQDPLVLSMDLAHVLHKACQTDDFKDWNPHEAAFAAPEGQAIALARMLNQLNDNIHLILDRTELLSRASGQWVQRFQRRLAEGHQVLLAGYESSPLPFAQWLSKGETLILGPQDLCFTPAESQHLLRHLKNQAKDIHEHLEGWPVGVALVARGGSYALGATELIEEQLRLLPANHLQHFHELAVLEVWNEKEAKELGCQVPSGWLKAAVQIGLPLSPLGGGSYRPHQLLLQMMQEHFLSKDPTRYQLLCEKLGDQLLHSGQELAATFYYIRAQQYAKCELLAKKQIKLALNHFNADLALRLAQDMYQLSQESEEEYLLQKVLALLDCGKLKEAKAIFEDHPFLQRTPLYHQAKAYLLYRQGNYTEQLNWAEQGLRLEMDSGMRCGLLTYKAMALGMLYRNEEKLTAALEALQLAIQEQNQNSEARIYSILGDTYGDLGQQKNAEDSYMWSQHLFKKLGHLNRINEIYHNLACCYLDWGNLKKAKALVNQALDERLDGFFVWEPLFRGLKAKIMLFQNENLHLAIDHLKEAFQMAEERGWSYHAYKFIFYICEAFAHLKDFDSAWFWMKRAEAKIISLKHDFDEYHYYSLIIKVHQGNPLSTSDFINIDPAALTQDQALTLQLLKIWLSYQKGQKVTGDLSKLLEHENIHLPIKLNMQPIKPMLETTLLPQTYKKIHLSESPYQSSETPKHMHYLQIITLDGFKIKINGNLCSVGLKKSQELLVYLGIYGAKTRDQLIDALWNGTMTRDTIDYFKVALRKLRTAIRDTNFMEIDPIIYTNGFYQFHESIHLEFDFDELLNMKPSLDNLQSLLGKSLLDHLDSDWIGLLNTSVQQQAVDKILTILETENPPLSVARTICEKILHVNPFENRAYRNLIDLLHLHGLHQEAQQVQLRYQQEMPLDLLN